uniref:Glycosyl transferase family 2 n=1 Tax=Cyanothece sp. (strain PCC 7425 / ATCC 29141) TaxID=395961 RepID=B8HRB2_CYAP4
MKISQSASNLPLVSVIIPAYNAEAFIQKTLKSVLTQTYTNIEVLVVDDGSQDRTAEIVQAIAKDDPRVDLLQQSNAGVAAARNKAIQATRGEFVAPIDADDIWYPQNLEKQVQCLLKSDSNVGFVYSWSLEIDEQGLLSGGFHAAWHQGEVYLKLLIQFFIGNASATLIRRVCLEETNGYNCELRAMEAQGCEDWDLYLRLAERYHANVVPEFLVGYRQLKNSMSRNLDLMARSQSLVLEASRNHHPELPTAVYRWSTSRFYIYLASCSRRIEDFSGTSAWLFRALELDPVMVLICPELYIFVFQFLFRGLKIFPGSNIGSYQENKPLNSVSNVTIRQIQMMIRIREFLPSTLQEKLRIKIMMVEVKLRSVIG